MTLPRDQSNSYLQDIEGGIRDMNNDELVTLVDALDGSIRDTVNESPEQAHNVHSLLDTVRAYAQAELNIRLGLNF